jgi:hypothetical protein
MGNEQMSQAKVNLEWWLSCLALPCLVLPCFVLPYFVLSCLILPCLVFCLGTTYLEGGFQSGPEDIPRRSK